LEYIGIFHHFNINDGFSSETLKNESDLIVFKSGNIVYGSTSGAAMGISLQGQVGTKRKLEEGDAVYATFVFGTDQVETLFSFNARMFIQK